MKIAVLTSGGDAPGMNPCIRAIAKYGDALGLEVYGVRRGFQGLIDGDFFKITKSDLARIIHRGGTMLKSARVLDFPNVQVQKKAADQLKKEGIEGLIVIGGDGSFRGARALSVNYDINVACIPATIDNDLGYTELSLGFTTAVDTVLWAVNSLRDTMGSHERTCIIEVMGRRCGDIALFAGMAAGADFTIVPEVPVNYDEIAAKIQANRDTINKSNLIMLSEGAGTCEQIIAELTKRIGKEGLRETKLGHVQRGGAPSMMDRVLATEFAAHAIDILLEGKVQRAIGYVNGQVIDMDIVEALEVKKVFRQDLYDIVTKLGL